MQWRASDSSRWVAGSRDRRPAIDGSTLGAAALTLADLRRAGAGQAGGAAGAGVDVHFGCVGAGGVIPWLIGSQKPQPERENYPIQLQRRDDNLLKSCLKLFNNNRILLGNILIILLVATRSIPADQKYSND